MRFETYLTEATTGLASWNKHFKGKEVLTTLNKDAFIYDSDGKKTQDKIDVGSTVTVLDIEPEKIGNSLLASIKYNTSIVKIPFNTIAKPITKGATEKLRINATNLTHGAKTETVTMFHKTFEAKIFTSSAELATIINSAVNNHKLIPDDIKLILTRYLEQKSFRTIEWGDSVDDSVMNELGKYLGELVIGLLALNGEISISGALGAGDVASFVVPDDPAFSGVDSLFIKKKDGTVVAISSKFGVGAKASFFSNLLPTLVNNKKNVKNKTLSKLIDIVERNSLNPTRQGKEILYRFGFENILKMKIDPMKVYTDIRKGVDSPEVQQVMDKINRNSWKLEGNEKQIKGKLPMSLTSFFSRSLSYMLNNDKKAIDEMILVLGAKDYWQANLDIAKWKQGNIVFKFVRSGTAELTIIGSKAAIGDITGSQGMVNYLLK